MKVIRLSQPDVEPITLEEAKLHLRVSHDDDDTMIEAMIASARELVENYCNRNFVSAGFAILFDGDLPVSDATLELPLPGITDVVSVQYRDGDDDVQTWDESGYSFDAERQTLRPTGAWPDGTDLRVEVQAGDASSAPQVPPAIRAAILLHVGDLYDARYAHGVGQDYGTNPAAALLMHPYRERMGI